ncbi:Zinc finger BED domain-containing protein 1 [Merluccius polli]|uniref:Zinc finger BED domain-containing protein 1 n=1 Tax=Merluccius polli TaxID=89951 RepID=A0AA47M595_MERPO|nr:Zinc finger BED domain-containing protein 1 [Merluccius polli]
MTFIPEVIKLMSPLKVATTLLSEEKNPTPMIAPIQAKLQRHFQPDESDLLVISQMKERFRQDFDGRYAYLQDLLYYASALDPRFKDLAFLDDNEAKDLIFMKLTAEVVQMNGQEGGSDTEMQNEDQAVDTLDDEDYAATASDTLDEAVDTLDEEDLAVDTHGVRSLHEEEQYSEEDCHDYQMFGDFLTARATVKTTRERAKEEILKYRERDSLCLGGDVLQWWKKQVDLPLLSALAKSYLSIPATSVPSERVFSTAGDIVTAQRSLLHPDHVDQLIFLKKNLRVEHLA